MPDFLKIDKDIDTKIGKLEGEIRNFDLLNEYNFKLMSELPNNAKPAKKTIYFEANGDKIKYAVLVNKTKIENVLDIRPPTLLTKDFLKSNRRKILKYTSERGHTKSSVQQKINRYQSLTAYRDHSQKNDFLTRFNGLARQAFPYSDRCENEYPPSSYAQISFELVMFDFISSHMNFIKVEQEKNNGSNKESNKPDFIFKENGESHYIECTTNTSGLLDKFVALKPSLSNYLKAATILYKDFKEKQVLYHNRKDTPLYSAFLRNAVYELDPEKKRYFIAGLSQATDVQAGMSLGEAIKIFEEQTEIINYSCFYHKGLIDARILSELEKIEFPINLRTTDENDSVLMKEFLTRSIARTIVDKAKKDYSKKGRPVTLAISFALRSEFTLHALVHEQLFPYLEEKLNTYIQEELSKEKDNQARSEFERAIKNLYAIIIDTTWYNWIPDIAEQRYGASFKSEKKNCYICIYNESHAMVKSGRKIFTQTNESNIFNRAVMSLDIICIRIFL